MKQVIKNQNALIFMGTPEFAAIVLEKMISGEWRPEAAVTQPDKPIGRRRELLPSPVKQLAEKNNIPVLQPEKIRGNKGFEKQVRDLKPDLIVVAAYGQIIPREILDIPRFGCLNVHPSLLPKYRGSSPIQSAILSGDRGTGVSIMLLDEETDHGPILANLKLNIENSKLNREELSEKLAEMGAKLLIETLPQWLSGKIKPIPQNHSEATFTKTIEKKDALINWNDSADKIERQVRAYYPWPVAFSRIKTDGGQKTLKIFQAETCETQPNFPKEPGKIFLIDKKMAIACGEDCLILDELQLEGKKRTAASDFLNGHPEIIDTILQ